MHRQLAVPLLVALLVAPASAGGQPGTPPASQRAAADDSPYALETVAGRWLGDGGPATEGVLNFPEFLHVVRASGTILVVDGHNDRIRRVDPGADGVVTGAPDETITTLVDGVSVAGGGLASDAAGNVYFTEPGLGLVWHLGADGERTLIAGTLPSNDAAIAPGSPLAEATPGPDPLEATAVRLASANGLVFDDDRGVLYIAETAANRVLKVDGGRLSVVAGAGGAPGLAGDNQPAVSAEVAMNQPLGLALDAVGDLYIADLGNRRVRKVDQASGLITTFAVMPDPDAVFPGSWPGQTWFLHEPVGLAADPVTGDLFVTTPLANRVWRVDPTGAVSPFAGTGQADQPLGSSPEGGPALADRLRVPAGVAVDGAGDVYVAESLQVTKVSRGSGLSTRVAGVPYGDGIDARLAVLAWPTDVVVDDRGTVYVADSYGRTVRAVDPRTGQMETAIGSAVGDAGWADGHPRAEAQFNQLNNLALGRGGALYIGEGRNGTVRKAFPGADGAFDGSPDERVITVVGVPFPVTGSEQGSPEPVADGTPALEARLSGTASFFKALAEDRAGNLFVADIGHGMVYRVAPGADGEVNGGPGETVTRVAGVATDEGDERRGTYGCGAEGVQARKSPLAFPSSLAFDADGNLFVADEDCTRVRRIAHGGDHLVDGGPGETVTTVAGPAGKGRPNEGAFAWGAPADGPALAARFSFPRGLAFDADGNLLVADHAANAVRLIAHGGDRRIDGGPEEVVTTIAGTGEETAARDGQGGDPADDFRDRGPASGASLAHPFAVAVGPDGGVYVADTANLVVRRLVPTWPTGTETATPSP